MERLQFAIAAITKKPPIEFHICQILRRNEGFWKLATISFHSDFLTWGSELISSITIRQSGDFSEQSNGYRFRIAFLQGKWRFAGAVLRVILLVSPLNVLVE